MSTIKARGFGSPSELQEHLDDIDRDDDPPQEEDGEDNYAASLREVAWLRKEVMDLRQRLQVIQGGPGTQKVNPISSSIMTLGMVAVTLLIGVCLKHGNLRVHDRGGRKGLFG